MVFGRKIPRISKKDRRRIDRIYNVNLKRISVEQAEEMKNNVIRFNKRFYGHAEKILRKIYHEHNSRKILNEWEDLNALIYARYIIEKEELYERLDKFLKKH